MKVIILAAGEGVRMRPLTESTPKPLLKAGGKSLLEHSVLSLPDHVNELIVVTGYLANQVREHAGEEFLGRKVTYVHQPQKLGTYHAVELCKHLIKDGEKFFLVFADDLIDKSSLERASEHDLAVVVSKVERPERFGIVSLDQNGHVVDVVEKPANPASNLALTNAYLLDKNVLDPKYRPEQAQNGEYYLSHAIAKMSEDYKIAAIEADFWFPVGTPEDLKKANEILREKPTS